VLPTEGVARESWRGGISLGTRGLFLVVWGRMDWYTWDRERLRRK